MAPGHLKSTALLYTIKIHVKDVWSPIKADMVACAGEKSTVTLFSSTQSVIRFETSGKSEMGS